MAAKERILTDQQKLFLESLFGDSEGDFRTAMRAAGYSDNTTRGEIIKTLGDEIVQTANGILALDAPKAAHKLRSLLDNPNMPGAANLHKAAAEILNRVGVQKASGDVQLKVPTGGLVILPAKGSFNEVPNSDELEDLNAQG